MINCILRDDRQKKAAFLDSSKSSLVILERLPVNDADVNHVHDNGFDVHECNGVYKWGSLMGHTKVTVIEPCDQEHIRKYSASSQTKRTIVETHEMYTTITKAWIDGQERTMWVDNIINGLAETEKVIHSDQHIVILPDSKWVSGETDDLYLLCLFKDPMMKSLRDLSDPRLLMDAKRSIMMVLKERYNSNNISLQDVSVYFHYPPTYYRLHCHIVHNRMIEFVSSHVHLAHSLDTVIHNLSLSGSYYRMADLPMLVGPQHPLYDHVG